MGISDKGRGGLLLLEDDPGICELEAQRLEPLGLPIRRTHSAEECEGALAAGPCPELLLVDYSLPGKNALQFIDGLKAAGTGLPPFIVVTGRGDEAVAVSSMKAGACDYLIKNSEFLDNLLPAVRKALERLELQRQLEAARASTAKNLHLYTFLAQVNVAAARTRDRGDLYRKICDIAVSAGLRMAWIGVLDRDLGRIIPFCWSGDVGGYLDGIRIYVGTDRPEANGPTGTAAATLRISHCADIEHDPEMAPWREKALARGYRSSAAIPLEEGGALAAVLNLHSGQAGFFAGDELNLLEEIKADISLALDAISAEERRASAQAQLERTAADLAHIMDVTPVMLFKLRAPASGAPALEWVSGNCEALTGYTPGEVLKPGWVKENMHPEDRAAAGDISDIQARKTLVRDFRFRRKNGDYFWVHAQLKLSGGEAGEITGSWTDITALKESEARFQDLFEKAPLGYQSLDEEGRFIEVNQAWLDTLGYKREEVIGKWFGDFVAPEYREAFSERFPRFKAAGRIHSEFEMLRRNGERLFIAFDGRIARTPTGEFQRTHCILKDISDAKLAETRLKSSEARFRTLFESGNDAMFLHPLSPDPAEMKFVEVNQVACERLGYSHEELLRLGPADIDAEGTAAARADAIRRLAADGRAVFEMTHRAKDGRLIPVEVSAGRFDYDGRPYVMSVARDLTERRRAEAERSLLSEAVKASLNEVYIFDDATLRFKFVNQAALGNLGYSLREMTALTPLDLKPEISKEEFAALIVPLRGGRVKVATFVTRHRRKDGSLYPVEVHLQHVPGNGVFLAVINDITERQKVEAALRQQTDLLRLAGRAARFGGWRVEKGKDKAVWTDETAMLHDMPAGYSPTVAEAINFYTPESRPAITEAVQACLEEGKPFDIELQMVSAKGRKFWARAIGQAERDGAGSIVSISGSFQDIDERKRLQVQAAAALEEASRFRDAMDRVPAYVYIKDLEGRYMYANAHTLKLFGCGKEELAGRRDQDFFPPETVALIKEKDAAVFSGGQSSAEIPVRDADGGETLYFESKAPLYADPEKKRIIGLLGISTDVTHVRRVERELRESEAFNRMLLDNLPIGISVNSVSHGVEFSYMNDRFPAFYRTTRERLAGKDAFWEAVYEDPEFRSKIKERVLADIASGDPARMRWEDVPIKRGDRTWYISAQGTPLPGKDLLISTVWDVTDRNEAMQAAQQRAQEALEAQRRARLGTFKLDLTAGKFQVSEVIHEIYGIDASYPHDLAGWRALVHPDDREAVAAELDRLVTGKTQEYRAESRIVRPSDGAVVWVNTRAHLEKAPDGRAIAVIGTALDITERKVAEKERERLAAAIDQTGEAVVITDRAGTIQYVNPAFERITGYSRAEVLGRNPSMLKSGKQDAGFYTDMWDKLAAGRQWVGRLVNKRKDGRLFIEEAVISPVKDAQGRVANYVAVKRDVTERLALEERLIQSQKMESIGLLAGGVAHDFNNLLTGITGYAGMLKKALPAGDPKLSDLQEILYAAERASELTRQLLIFSRKEVARPVAMDVNEGVRSSQRLISRLIGEDVRLETELAPSACVTRMDPGHFAQVIMNLAVNARDAMPKGGTLTISTRCSVRPDDGSEPMHALEVSDTGCGMTPEVKARIFEPFFTTKDRGKGTGLGLPMIYGIVEQAGGQIRVGSEPGKGTRFTVYLPIAKLAPAERPGPAKEISPEGGRGETILFVEDEERLRVLGQRMLEAAGYKVLAAAGGGEALEKAMALGRPVDIVVSDLVLPGMNGRELAQELSRRGLASRFLYVSGYTDELISRHGVLEDGVAFLSKPFTPLTLTGKVREVLDGPPEKARP